MFQIYQKEKSGPQQTLRAFARTCVVLTATLALFGSLYLIISFGE
jgi:hypothetical protein